MSKSKAVVLSMGLAFFICMGIVAWRGEVQARAVSDGVLRFHVIANSDSDRDQQLKLKVRDGIAELTDKLFKDADSKEEASEIALQHKDEICKTAEDILRQNGDDSEVSMDVKRVFFPTKTYENITFPAGDYDAIQIKIGKAEGKNFWCVMFPALCVPSATGHNEEMLGDVLTDDAVDLVTHPTTFKFKIVELYHTVFHYFKK